jgi:ABC transporter substrate binding protein
VRSATRRVASRSRWLELGSGLPQCPLEQVSSYLGYTGRGANAFAKAARDPRRTSASFRFLRGTLSLPYLRLAAHEAAGFLSRSCDARRRPPRGSSRSRGSCRSSHSGAVGWLPRRFFKEKGWIAGRNLQIEYRITGGDTELTRRYARELIALGPDVLFAITNTSMAALHAEHSNIPTVFAMVSEPVGMHYVESFSKPGGTVTGFTPFEPSLSGKWVSLLKEVAPNVEHIGIVYNPEPGNNSAKFRNSIDDVANKVGSPRLRRRAAIVPTLIVLFARSRMSRMPGSFSCRMRSRALGAFRLPR